jgi:curli production assembly/transport component CsgG
VPIERENIGNLLKKEFNRSTRQEYSKDTDPNVPQITPLYAGVLLEGIISYDSNIITGGFGARYFGTGVLSNTGRTE